MVTSVTFALVAATPMQFSQTDIPKIVYGKDIPKSVHLGEGASPAYSPDGDYIAFSGEGHKLYIMDSAGNNKRPISKVDHNFSPSWNPDGNEIAFNSYGENMSQGKFSIWVTNTDGTNQHQLIDPAAEGDQYPCWSRDGKHIVWTHGQQLWIADSNGQRAKPLTLEPAKAYEFCGEWSPKEDVIAYIAANTHDGSSPEYYRIWTVRPDGKEQKLFAGGILAQDVRWSRDGKFLYYSTGKGVMKIDSDGRGPAVRVFDLSRGRFDISHDEKLLIYENEAGHLYKVTLVSNPPSSETVTHQPGEQRVVPDKEPSPETCDRQCSLALAHVLAEAYDRNNPRAIEVLHNHFDAKLDLLFESGALEEGVELLQIVMPAAAKWAADSQSSVDVWPTLRMLSDWQTLVALAHNQSEPTRIELRSIAKDEIPLQISVEGGERETKAHIYRSFNSNKEWIGETPQHVILYPGLNRLILVFFEKNEVVGLTPILDLTLDDGRVRVDALQLLGYRGLNELLGRMPGLLLSPTETGQVEFISSLRQRYPPSSVLRPKKNGVLSLKIPRLPPLPLKWAAGGPIDWGRADYRKIQIESNPTGASILLNGEPRGTTPRAITSKLSTLRMVLRKPGYLETAAEIKLTEPVTVIHANLNSMP
jgi:dipeptidyl aminopeptidase/acylaminoacyl peptidase